MSCGDEIREDLGLDVNKPDFRELDLGSPISTLRVNRHRGQATTTTSGLTATTTTTTTSTSNSSSSSGSFAGRAGNAVVTNSISAEGSGSNGSSPKAVGNLRSVGPTSELKSKHLRPSEVSGSRQSLGFEGSVDSRPPPRISIPTGNICSSGKIPKTGMAANRTSKTDVLGSGTGNYGHGSIMWGGGNGSVISPRGNVGSDSPARKVGSISGSLDPEELKVAGNEQYKKGHFSEALGLYNRAISLSPGNAAYHSNRAAALIGLGRLTEAVEECQEAVRLDPKYSRAHQRLGSLLIRLGQVDNARKHLCFIGQQPDTEELQKLQAVEKHLGRCNDGRKKGDWKSTLREVDAAIAAGADSSPQLFSCRAEALLKLHKLDDATLTLSNAPKYDLSSHFSSQMKLFGMLYEAYFYFVQAQIDIAFGRFDNAVTAAEKAAQLDPRNIEVSVLLNNVKSVARARARGNDLFKSERFTEACSTYGEGLKLDPSNAVLYCNRAACWFKLGQWARSIEDSNQALIIQPNYTKALLRRAASYIKTERWGDAIKDYKVLRRELPDDNDIAESLLHAQDALKNSQGEEVHNVKLGGKIDVEQVWGLDQFRAAISSPGVIVVHFKSALNAQCVEISSFIETLSSRYSSVKFLKVDTEENPSLAHTENVRITPTFKIYKNGIRVREMISPTRQVLEYSVRHYSF